MEVFVLEFGESIKISKIKEGMAIDVGSVRDCNDEVVSQTNLNLTKASVFNLGHVGHLKIRSNR